MKILSIDSSTEAASCAVLDDDKLLGEITFNYKKQHSVILMELIQNILKGVNLSINDMDAFVVSKGPGSFTGLRIGMATAKGLAQGSNKPLISLSSLDALAYNLCFSEGIICPILDALRGNVYTALYKFSGEKLERLSDYLVISVDELIYMLKEKNQTIHFIGDGIYKFKEKLQDSFEKCTFAPSHLNFARASSLGELGLKLARDGVSDDIFTLTPIYIRKSQAEQEYEKKYGKSAY